MKLYVGNLPWGVTEEEVRGFFSPHKVKVTLCTDRDTGRFRGFGFVEIADEAVARVAISELNGCELGGRTLKIDEATEKRGAPKSPDRGPRPDRGGHQERGGGRRRSRDSDYE